MNCTYLRSKELAKRYGFSPRLTALMLSNPNKPKYAGIGSQQTGDQVMASPSEKAEDHSMASDSTDPERNEKGNERVSNAGGLDLNHYNIVNEVWYYCSVDWGSKCKSPAIKLFILTKSRRPVYWL